MAHGDDEGTLGEVGDGPEPTNLTKMAAVPRLKKTSRAVLRHVRGLVAR